MDSFLFNRSWHPTKTVAEAFYFWAQSVLSLLLSFHSHLCSSQLTRWHHLLSPVQPTDPNCFSEYICKESALQTWGTRWDQFPGSTYNTDLCNVLSLTPQLVLPLEPWQVPMCLDSISPSASDLHTTLFMSSCLCPHLTFQAVTSVTIALDILVTANCYLQCLWLRWCTVLVLWDPHIQCNEFVLPGISYNVSHLAFFQYH